MTSENKENKEDELDDVRIAHRLTELSIDGPADDERDLGKGPRCTCAVQEEQSWEILCGAGVGGII